MLDVFGGSGSTLIAADQCGRVARLIEIDPLYCDTIIRRFERVTGEQAYLASTETVFADVRVQRERLPGAGNGNEDISQHSLVEGEA